MNPAVNVLLKCVIRFSISCRWYAFPNFCTQISRPLAYGVRVSSKASATAAWWTVPPHLSWRSGFCQWCVFRTSSGSTDLHSSSSSPETDTLPHLWPAIIAYSSLVHKQEGRKVTASQKSSAHQFTAVHLTFVPSICRTVRKGISTGQIILGKCCNCCKCWNGEVRTLFLAQKLSLLCRGFVGVARGAGAWGREYEARGTMASLPLPIVPRALHILALRSPHRAPPQQNLSGGERPRSNVV